MGGFASCMPADDLDVRRTASSGLTAGQQQQRRTSSERPMRSHRAKPAQSRRQLVIDDHREQTEDTAEEGEIASPPRVPHERHSSQFMDTHAYTTSGGCVDVHANARVFMEATPNGKEKTVFPFFCPICFLHYKEIYKSACCSNYVCVPCALGHVEQQLGLASPLARMPVDPIAGVCCPSCNTETVSFLPVVLDVQRGERPRNYAESPHTRDLLAGADVRKKLELHLESTDEAGDATREEGAVSARAPSRQSSFRQRKILTFESEQGDEENAREGSISRSRSTALPPRRPLTATQTTNNENVAHAVDAMCNKPNQVAADTDTAGAIHSGSQTPPQTTDAAYDTSLTFTPLPLIPAFHSTAHGTDATHPDDLSMPPVASLLAKPDATELDQACMVMPLATNA